MRFIDLEVARRLEVADQPDLAATEREFLGDRVIEEIAGGYAVFAGVNSPATQAEGLGLYGPVTEDGMDRPEEFFRSRGSAVVLEVCPLADASLLEILGKRGYRAVEFSNVLVRDLRREEVFPAPAPGIRVRAAAPSERRLWAKTVADGFAEQFRPGDELVRTLENFFGLPPLRCFLATADGFVCGGGSLTIRCGVAGLSGTSALPDFRRRGVQAALIRARLAHAGEAGCDLAMSITRPGSGSQRNIERHGFGVAYTRTKFIRE